MNDWEIERLLSEAVRHFWSTRQAQTSRQGQQSGIRDAGNRKAVTGGKHADGFIRMVGEIVIDAGLEPTSVHTGSKADRTLPGYFRPTKEWDLLVVLDQHLIAAVEVKSQVGSLGNNFNNRVEEAVGNATDFWRAYAKEMFPPAVRPWLGYLFLLESSEESLRPTQPLRLRHFAADADFDRRSYAQRYAEVCRRLVRERLYDAACFVMSFRDTGVMGQYSEPSPELGIIPFARSLHAHASRFSGGAPIQR
jgi:hypothetical protein